MSDSKSVLPPQSRLALLQQWARVTAMTARAIFAPASAVLTDELSAAVKAAAARLARQNGGLAVARGPANENYWNVFDAIVKADNTPARPMVNITTRGALENLRLLRDGAGGQRRRPLRTCGRGSRSTRVGGLVPGSAACGCDGHQPNCLGR